VADGVVAGQGTGEAQAEGTETARVVFLLTTPFSSFRRTDTVPLRYNLYTEYFRTSLASTLDACANSRLRASSTPSPPRP